MVTTPAGPTKPATLPGSATFAPADLPALEVASYYLPVDVRGIGGDWLDVIALPRARVALVVGDVVGHGVAAAATMGRLRAAVHTLAAMDLPAEDVLARLDGFAARLAEQEARPDDFPGWIMSATCLYLVYDPATRRCNVARAGHPPPAISDSSGGVTFPDLPAGTPIGLGMRSFESAEIEVPEESVIALYTDGLIESRETDIDTGLKRLSSALACTAPVLHEYCAQVIDTMTTAYPPRQDDIALLMARTRSPDARDLTPPCRPVQQSVGTTRRCHWPISSLSGSTTTRSAVSLSAAMPRTNDRNAACANPQRDRAGPAHAHRHRCQRRDPADDHRHHRRSARPARRDPRHGRRGDRRDGLDAQRPDGDGRRRAAKRPPDPADRAAAGRLGRRLAIRRA
jgi:hypothetical protein